MVKDGITNPLIGIWEIINEKKNRRKVMPMGKGTYGSKKGRPPKKNKNKKKSKKKKLCKKVIIEQMMVELSKKAFTII